MLTNDMKVLLELLANGNITKARLTAIEICKKDNTEKNRQFCERIIQKLETAPKMLGLPREVSELLFTDDIGVMFDEELFYVSKREERLAEQMIAVQKSAEKLQGIGLHYRNAVLMFGPTGSGKTAYAKHLARLMDREFFVVNLANIIDSHLGGTGKNLSKVFRAICERGPNCLLFLDELDAVTENREGDSDGSTSKEMNRVTMALMQQMDMLPPDTVVIAATNRVDRIDYALRRRFPIIHKFEPFTFEERKAMVLKYLNTVKRRAAEVGSFDFDWSEEELDHYIDTSMNVSHARTIDTVTQALAEMLENNKTHLKFKALTDATGRKISSSGTTVPGPWNAMPQSPASKTVPSSDTMRDGEPLSNLP